MDQKRNKGSSPLQQGRCSSYSVWLPRQCFRNEYRTETIFLWLHLWANWFSCLSGWGR